MMRILLALALSIPSLGFAETLHIQSAPTAVTLHPYGARITREVPYSVPAGQSTLLLTNLPREADLAFARVSLSNATLISTSQRDTAALPDTAEPDEAVIAAQAKVDDLTEQLLTAQEQVNAIRAEAEAEEARIAFLTGLAGSEAVAGMDVEKLQNLSSMIANQTLAARITAGQAHLRANNADRGLKDLRDDLADAQQALDALQTASDDYASLALTVSADATTEGTLTLTYLAPGEWRPAYDIYLDRDASSARIERSAVITQTSGEDWTDVALTLSTADLMDQTAPSEVYPIQRWIEEEQPQLTSRMMGKAENMAAPAPVLMEVDSRVAEADFDGLVASYAFPDPVSVANASDNLKIALDTLETKATIYAEAVPARDKTAFFMAELTNDLGEPLAKSNNVTLFVDDRLASVTSLDRTWPIDADQTFAFGAIEGLRLKHITKDRNTGEAGVFTRSNERTEEYVMSIENLTDQDWPVKLRHAVPFSEQEDLEIAWQATPRPTEENVEGKRGVLLWELNMTAGGTQKVELRFDLSWPEGFVLR